MTPISFALELLLDCETVEEVHKKCRKYIKYLESKETQLHKPQIMIPNLNQAPSTQRLLEAHAQAPPPPIIPRSAGGEVNNGDGTKGKRKW